MLNIKQTFDVSSKGAASGRYFIFALHLSSHFLLFSDQRATSDLSLPTAYQEQGFTGYNVPVFKKIRASNVWVGSL